MPKIIKSINPSLASVYDMMNILDGEVQKCSRWVPAQKTHYMNTLERSFIICIDLETTMINLNDQAEIMNGKA